MDQQDNILRQILQKLDALEDQLHNLENRLESVETLRSPMRPRPPVSPKPLKPPTAPEPQPAPESRPTPAPGVPVTFRPDEVPFTPYDTPVTIDLDHTPPPPPEESTPSPDHVPFAPHDTPVTIDLDRPKPEDEPPAPAPEPALPQESTSDAAPTEESADGGFVSIDEKMDEIRRRLAMRHLERKPQPKKDTGTEAQPASPAPEPPADRDAKFQQAVAGLRPDVVPAQPKESWEVRIATTWLPRIGLFFLALVCLLFAREYTQGPLGKIIATYAVAIVLVGVGLWKEKTYPQWARPVMAGGLAFSYFASYAMGFVEPMRLLESLTPKLIILGINLVIIFGVAHWKKSEVIGGTALILGYLTTGVVGQDVAAFSSSVALSVAALLFLWLNKWYAATALACVATYLAHFYVWRFVPGAEVRTPAEAFWHHFLFLSLYFTVFTAAALTGKSAAHDEDLAADHRGMFSRPVQSLSRHNILTGLSQANVVAYIVGMITLLRITGVYWDRAWMFLLPMATVFAGLGLLFVGFATVQMTYLVASTLCLTLGLIAAASPMWLPVFLALQALGMLIASRGRYAPLWHALSLIILGYAGGYVITGSTVDVLQLSSAAVVDFPWWTFAAVAAIALAFVITWERRLRGLTTGLAPVGHYFAAFMAVFVWANALRHMPAGSGFIYHIAAIPIATFAAVLGRSPSISIFIIGTIIVALINFPGIRAVSLEGSPWQPWLAAIGVIGIVSAFVTEKGSTGDRSYDRWIWRPVYVWSQIITAIAFILLLDHPTEPWSLTALFVLCIAAAWVLRSSALAKSAFIPACFLFISAPTQDVDGFAIAVLLAAAVYPMGLPAWAARTGDTFPNASRWLQAAIVLISVGIVANTVDSHLQWNLVLTLGALALAAAAYAASGRFKPVITVVLVCATGMLLHLGAYLAQTTGSFPEEAQSTMAATAGYSLLGVFLLVMAERVLAMARNRKFAFSGFHFVNSGTVDLNTGHYYPWLLPNNQALLTSVLALGTLVMAVMAIRILPDLRLFYFTGAMVAVAFIWIVFGFWFKESAYRKVGFILLCIGIVKGLIWDVLSLKQTLYRIVSWSILGLLAIAASFLYTRFKTQLTHTENNAS